MRTQGHTVHPFASACLRSREEAPRTLRRRAAPSRHAMWQSWPQACMTPLLQLQKGSPVASVTGRASMSARRATTGLREHDADEPLDGGPDDGN